jgi:hypothetical protein
MPRVAWAGLLFVAIGSAPIAAQPLPPAAPLDHPPPILGGPIAVRGEPVRANVEPFPPTRSLSESFSIPAGLVDAPAVPGTQRPVRVAGLGVPFPVTEGATPAANPTPVDSAAEPVRRGASSTPAASDPVNDFLTKRSDYKTSYDRIRDRGPERRSTSHWTFGENIEGLFGDRGNWFRSDHAFDGFISPVTNPFLFEDPRSLTEVRPIFIYQKIPGGQLDFKGGGISYFGVQGRVAFTDRLSFVINKLGGIWVNPGSDSIIPNQSGFAELWFGPKYTFIRNENCGSLMAGGLQFQVPVGSQSGFQSNGTLSLVPYVSAAQNLFRDFTAGSFNVMGTTGYSFSTTSARSDYWYLSGHIDMDVLNRHRFYPLIEMNYFLVSKNGNTTNIGAEGRDLINFGGQAAGKGMLTTAFGARYKIIENAQIGGAFELPIAGPHDLFQYRFTLDFILRY